MCIKYLVDLPVTYSEILGEAVVVCLLSLVEEIARVQDRMIALKADRLAGIRF